MLIRAAVTAEHGKFDFRDVELDEPKADEVLIKIAASGCCHTDLGALNGIAPWPLPGVLGHEGSGIVEKVGSMVQGIKPGDHVVISYQACGCCSPCLHGHPARCDTWYPLNFFGKLADGSSRLHTQDGEQLSVFFGQSSFATYAVANQRQVVVVDPEIDIRLLGPLGCGFGTGAGSVINVLKAGFGDSIAIFGTGGVGLAAVMAARITGCEKIIAVDIKENRLELAEELGATHIVNSAKVDATEEIRNITAGKGVNYAFDTSGHASVINSAINAAANYSTICTIAMSTDDLTIGIESDIMGPGRTIKGSTEGDAVSKIFIPQLIEYYKQGRFPFDKLCKFYKFEDIDKAFADSCSGETIKPILYFD